jgi:hypothetical protein
METLCRGDYDRMCVTVDDGLDLEVPPEELTSGTSEMSKQL